VRKERGGKLRLKKRKGKARGGKGEVKRDGIDEKECAVQKYHVFYG